MADTADRLVYTIEVKDFASKPLEEIKKQLQGFDTAIARMAKEFEKFNAIDLTGFKVLATALDPFLTKMKDAAPAFQAMAKGMDIVTEKAAKMEDAAKKNERTWKSWQESLKDGFVKAVQGLDGMARGVENFIKNGANIDKVIVGAFKNIVTAIKDAGEALLHFAANIAVKAFEGIIGLAKKAAEGVAEFAVSSVKAYANFEEQLIGARRTMDLTDEGVKVMMKNLQELALNFEEGGLKAGVTTKSLAEIAEIAGQMNIKLEDGKERFNTFIETVAKASNAFGMSADSTASALGIISNVFNVPIEKANELGGAIATIGIASVATVPEILNFMQRVGAVGTSMGLTANEAAALGGMFREAGLTMEIAGTATVNIFTKMKTELDKFAETLAAGGVSKEMLETAIRSKDAAGALQLVIGALQNINAKDPLAAAEAMKDLGLTGRNATVVLESLMAQFPKFREFVGMIEDPMKNIEALNNAYEASLAGLNRQWAATKTIVEVISQVIGEKLSNALAIVIEKYLNPFLLKFQEWIQKSPVAQAILEAIGQAILWAGEQLAILGDKFLAWLNAVDSAAAGEAVTKWFQTMGEKAVKFWEDVQKIDLGKVFADAAKILSAIADALSKSSDASREWGGYTLDILRGIGAAFTSVIVAIEKTAAGLGYMFDRGTKIQPMIDAIGRWKKAIIDEAVQRYFETIFNFFDKVGDQISKIIEWWKKLSSETTGYLEKINLVGKATDAVFSGMLKAIGEVSKFLANGLTGGALDALIGKLKKVEDVSHGRSVFPDMVDWAGKAAGAVDSISNSAFSVSKALGGVNTQMAAIAASPAQNIQADQALRYLEYRNGLAAASRPLAQARIMDTPIAAGGTTAGGKGTSEGSKGVNITINAGASVLDDRSMQTFAKEISRTMQEGKGGVISSK